MAVCFGGVLMPIARLGERKFKLIFEPERYALYR